MHYETSSSKSDSKALSSSYGPNSLMLIPLLRSTSYVQYIVIYSHRIFVEKSYELWVRFREQSPQKTPTSEVE